MKLCAPWQSVHQRPSFNTRKLAKPLPCAPQASGIPAKASAILEIIKLVGGSYQLHHRLDVLVVLCTCCTESAGLPGMGTWV